MKTFMMKVSEIKSNPDNPRKISQQQLDRLKKSITDLPQMLEARPIVIDENNIVLGGNMRLKAITELGFEEVPVVKITDLTDEQQKAFVIKDNVNYGDWNWDILQQENWDLSHIQNWGLDIPKWLNDDDTEPQFDMGNSHNGLKSYINSKVKQITLFLTNEQYEDTIEKLAGLMEYEKLESNTDAVLWLIKYYYETDLSEETGD